MLAPFSDRIRGKSIKNPSKNRGIDFSSIFSIFHRFLIDFGPSKAHGPIGYPSFGARFYGLWCFFLVLLVLFFFGFVGWLFLEIWSFRGSQDPRGAYRVRPRPTVVGTKNLQMRDKNVVEKRLIFGWISDRFSTPTWRQLGLPNPSKSMTNRCQDALPS